MSLTYQDLVGRHPLFPSPEQVQERLRLQAAQFFLVKTAGFGDRLLCDKCGLSHRYLTWCCIEQPFNGLTEGIRAYWHVAGAALKEPGIPSSARARVARITAGMSDLATAQPQMAGKLAVANGDLLTGGFDFTAHPDHPGELALGVFEPIPATTARLLAARIRGRDPNYLIAGLPKEEQP